MEGTRRGKVGGEVPARKEDYEESVNQPQTDCFLIAEGTKRGILRKIEGGDVSTALNRQTAPLPGDRG